MLTIFKVPLKSFLYAHTLLFLPALVISCFALLNELLITSFCMSESMEPVNANKFVMFGS